MKNIFYPKTKLFPHHPQVLHQLALQLFLMADKFEHIFTKEEMSRGIIVPRGSYFDIGLTLAAGYRYRLQAIKPKKIIAIIPLELESKKQFIGCNYDSLHTFFGEIEVNKDVYDNLPELSFDNSLFEKHADPIVAQIPFIRSYRKVDSITPVIVNKKSSHLSWESIRTALYDSTGETGYIICTNEQSDHDLAQMAEAYHALSSEQLMTFGPERKIS